MLAFSVVAGSSGLAPAAAAKDKPYSAHVVLGYSFPHRGGFHIGIVAELSSGDFFHDLSRVKGPDGAEYYKGHTRVEFFPSTLSLELVAKVARPLFFPDYESFPQDIRQLLDSLRIELFWKRGMYQRRIETFSVDAVRPDDPQWETAAWTYRVSIKSENVPLSDHLVICIWQKDGKLLTRLSGEL